MASESSRMRGLPTATAWRSTGRLRSIRRNGGASAPRNVGVSLLAPARDRGLCALDFAGALLVVDEDALAGGVHRRHALPALQLPQARLRRFTVGALLFRLGAILVRLLLRVRTLLLALLECLLGRERLVLVLARILLR